MPPRVHVLAARWVAAFAAAAATALPAAPSTALAPTAAHAQAAAAPPPAATDSGVLARRVDSLFAAYDRTGSPGCALGVIRDGRLVYARGYGMANLELGVAITPQTVFDIGSTSKQFAAMSIMLLAKQGKLSLDDDVRKHIPELPDYRRTITVRHLLTHTSGLRDYLTLMYLAGVDDADYTTDQDALDVITRQRELNFEPGSQYLYSNSGFFLLSVIVKRASGQSLGEFARAGIFAPLGMTHTRYNDDHTLIIPNRATGYAPRPGGGFAIAMSNFEQTGDGAVMTSVEDLLRWDRNFYTGEVGGRDVLDAMQQTATLTTGRKLTYALGLVVDAHRGRRTVSHGGAWAGYRAELVRFPDQRLSVACLCNLATANPSRLARQVADIFLGDAVARGDTARRAPATGAAASVGPSAAVAAPTVAAPTPPVLSAAALRRFAGLYRNLQTGELRRVSLRGDTLYGSNLLQQYALVPVDSATFAAAGALTPVTFAFDATGPGVARRVRVATGATDTAPFERVAEASPTSADLAQYAGTYESAELGASYAIALENGKLLLRRRRAEPATLDPTYRDAFSAGGLLIAFTRDRGRVTGMVVDAGRTRNLRFVRRPGR